MEHPRESSSARAYRPCFSPFAPASPGFFVIVFESAYVISSFHRIVKSKREIRPSDRKVEREKIRAAAISAEKMAPFSNC